MTKLTKTSAVMQKPDALDFRLESRPCPKCSAAMVYNKGEPWYGPTWGCTSCGHTEHAAKAEPADSATMCVWCETRVGDACKSHYDTLTCAHRVIAPTAEEFDFAIEARSAERNEGKSNAEHWLQRATEAEAEVAQARQTAEYWKAEHLAGNARIGELHDELSETALRAADYLRRAIKAEAEIARRDADVERDKHAHTDWVDDDVRVRHPRA